MSAGAARRAARARRRHDVRGRGHRRRPAGGVASGEVVFNTVLSGYQEVLSDPSYAGQIITFTYPHIGNYGANADDDESRRPFCRGVVVRDLARRRSNWRADADLDDYLRRHGVPGIAGVDTRRLTRHIRDAGAMPGAFGTADETTLKAAAAAEPGTDGVDLVATVTTAEPYTVGDRPAPGRRLRLRHQDDDPSPPVAHRHRRGRAGVDAGRRRARPRARRRVPLERPRRPRHGAVRHRRHPRPARRGAGVRHLPRPPAPRHRHRRGASRSCPFGHHGGNHPVRHLDTGQVEITSQNHNFAVVADSLAGVAEVTHVNLNDGVCEGLRVPRRPGLQRAAPPRGRSRPARLRLPLRPLRGADGCLRRRPTSSRSSSSAPGPIVIGQACEFDYSGTQACRVLREEGYRVILANSNPATIMTDPEFADATYVEPLDVDVLDGHHRARAARRRAADPRRADGAEPGHGARRARRGRHDRARPSSSAPTPRPSPPPRTASSSRWRCRGSACRCRRVGHRPHHGRGPRGRRPRRPAGRDPARRTSSAARAPASPPRPRSSSGWPPTASPPARSPRSSSSSRSPGGRSTSSRSCATGPTTAWSSARSRTSTRWACTPATRSPSRRPRRSPTSSTS